MSDEQTFARAQRIQEQDPNGAAELYRQLRTGPLAGRASLALGTMFLRRGLLDGAEHYLEAALSGPEVKAEALFALAGLERRRNNQEAAKARLAAYLELAPDDAEAVDLMRELETSLAHDPRAGAAPPLVNPGRRADDPDAAETEPATPVPRPLPSSMADVLAKKDLTDEEMQQSPGEVKWSRRPVWWCPSGVAGGVVRMAVLFMLASFPIAWLASSDSQHGMSLDQVQRLLWAAWPPALLLGFTWALLRWWTTWYTVYERRVEVRAGVLFQVHRGIWLYDVDRPVYLTSGPWQTLTGTGTVVIESDRLPARSLGFFFQYQKAGSWGQLKLAGFGVRGEAEKAVAYLTRQILRERKALKDRFV